MAAAIGDTSRALFERLAELERLRAAVGPREGGALAIEGAPGIGKTALLDAACQLAHEAGREVLRARCGEFEVEFPFGVARQLLERRVLEEPEAVRSGLLAGAASHAARALGIAAGDAGPGTPGADLPFTVVHGLYWLLANLAERGPILIAVDDAQWCDDASLRLLTYLLPRLAELPIVLVVASRPPEPERLVSLGSILGGTAVERVEPGPLGEVGVSRLLAARLGVSPDPEFAAACATATGGNPFLLNELGQSLVADGVRPDAASAGRVGELVPATVVHSVLLRMGRMPEPCGELAAAIAILGAEVEPRHATALAGISEAEASDPLAALERAEILAAARPLRFAHPLLREAVRAELSLARREELHGRAAEILRREGSRPEAVAHHLLNAPRAGSAETVATLRSAAAGALSGGAPEAAITYLTRALAEPPAADQRATVRYELGFAGWLAGRDHDAVVADLRAGLDGARSTADRATRAVALGRALGYGGDIPAAFTVLDGQLAAAGAGAGDAAARLRGEHGAIGLIHPDTRGRAAARIATAPDRSGSTLGDRLELANRAYLAIYEGSADEAAGYAERALAERRLLEAEGPDSLPFYEAILALMLADRHESAARHLALARDLARRRGSVFAAGSASILLGTLAWRRGELAAADSEIESALEPGRPPPAVYPLAITVRALVLTDRGELEEADAALAEAGVGPELPEYFMFNTAFFGRGALRHAQGRYQEALDDMAELERREERLGVLNTSVPWRGVATEAAMKLGDGDRARELAAAEAEYAERWGTATARGQALRALGLAKGEEGIADLREAVAFLDRSPARRERTLALLDLGAALRRAGQRREAREHLRAALDLAQACGATRFAKLAEAELRVAGAKPRRLQFSGLDSLTAAERRVATLVADGLANREVAESLFVSTRTVENHLSHAYRKLGIQSREQLPQALAPSD